MEQRTRLLLAGGCLFLLIFAVLIGVAVAAVPYMLFRSAATEAPAATAPRVRVERTGSIQAAPTFTPAPPVNVQTQTSEGGGSSAIAGAHALTATANLLSGRFNQLNPGVVNIQVFVNSTSAGQGVGAGSGFVLDTEGHIVTNNHVVEGATMVIIIFFNGQQALAEIVGLDDDSDLAVVRVDGLPEGVHPLPLADSDRVEVGDWAIAIGNPFGLGSSMTLGIVSAVGRAIPSGATQFNIPEAIQTDAAINPGNSGGPLLNLDGEVIGVNAQIRTGGANANTGVGFAIPANVVRHVVPTLIAEGAYEWPWLGVTGGSVNLALMEAMNLPSQQGAYIAEVIPGGPADDAGLRGSTGTAQIEGLELAVGGDVVIAIDGEPVTTFNDLLAEVAFKLPGQQTVLTILREGPEDQVTVTLEPRPESLGQEGGQ
jgi:S1-C subfamily serine protease